MQTPTARLPASMIAAGHDPANWPPTRTPTEIAKANLCATQHAYGDASRGDAEQNIGAFATATEIPADMLAPAYAVYLRQLPIARARVAPKRRGKKAVAP